MKNLIRPLCVVSVLGAFAMPAFAAIDLGIVGDVQIGSNFIDFGQFPAGAPYVPGTGTFETSLVNPTGIFSSVGVTTGELGAIQSLDEGTGPVTLPGPFLTFDSGGSNLQLIANFIPSGGTGPLVLIDTADGSVASFTVDGEIFDSNTSTEIGAFTGTFSATFAGLSVADLLDNLPVNTPFSATFTTSVVPEPASISLLAASGLMLMRRRRRV